MRRVAMVAALLLLVLTGCTGGPGPNMMGVLTIVASPSLTDAITGMAKAFMGTYPGVRVDTVFAPDSAIADGSAAPPRDLVVAEDPATLTTAGITGEPKPFAVGQLVLAVRKQSLATVRGLEDLAKPGVRVAVCAATEPCGKVTAAVLAAAQVTLGDNAVEEPDVRSALHHVTEGTADAALVYRSDAIGAGDQVITVELAVAGAAVAHFAAAVAVHAPNPGVAQVFLDYLTSEPVRAALVTDGFGPPQ
jgi:molybdate transport system substrate-binding protein